MQRAASKNQILQAISDTLLLGALVWLAIATTNYALPLLDDVYITLQHARNLVQGNGLVYQAGDRVLASTAPLHALILAAVLPFFAEPILPAVYLWTGSLALAGFVLYKIVGNPLFGAGAAVLLLTEPSLFAITGMETTLFVLVSLLALYLYQQQRVKMAFLVSGFGVLVRPDAVFLIAALGLADLVSHKRIRWEIYLPLAIVAGAWATVAWLYYGNPIPLSAIAKYYHGKAPYWGPGFLKRLGADLVSLRYALPSLGLLGCGLFLLAKRRSSVILVPVLFCLLYLLAYSVSKVPGYLNYFFPFYAFLFAASFLSLAQCLGAQTQNSGWTRHITGATSSLGQGLAAVVIAATGVVLYDTNWSMLNGPRGTEPQHVYLQVSEFLRNNTPENASIGIVEIGIVGFYGERRIVDLAGLATPGVAKALAAGNPHYAIDTLRPDYLVARLPTPWPVEGVTPADLAANYQLAFRTFPPAREVGVYRSIVYDVASATEGIRRGLAAATRDCGTSSMVVVSTHRVPPQYRDAFVTGLAPLGILFNPEPEQMTRPCAYFAVTFAGGDLAHIEKIGRVSARRLAQRNQSAPEG